MPLIVTSMKDSLVLAATCRRFGLPAPQQGTMQHVDRPVTGLIVRVAGTRRAIVCDTLTGFVYYHADDNAFHPYGQIVRFIQRYYSVRHELRKARVHPGSAA
jgi:hypothetical protein